MSRETRVSGQVGTGWFRWAMLAMVAVAALGGCGDVPDPGAGRLDASVPVDSASSETGVRPDTAVRDAEPDRSNPSTDLRAPEDGASADTPAHADVSPAPDAAEADAQQTDAPPPQDGPAVDAPAEDDGSAEDDGPGTDGAGGADAAFPELTIDYRPIDNVFLGQSDSTAEAAEALLRDSLTPQELQQLAGIDWTTITTDQYLADTIIQKAVIAVLPLLNEPPAMSALPSPATRAAHVAACEPTERCDPHARATFKWEVAKSLARIVVYAAVGGAVCVGSGGSLCAAATVVVGAQIAKQVATVVACVPATGVAAFTNDLWGCETTDPLPPPPAPDPPPPPPPPPPVHCPVANGGAGGTCAAGERCVSCGIQSGCASRDYECITCGEDRVLVLRGETCCLGAKGGLEWKCGPSEECRNCGGGNFCDSREQPRFFCCGGSTCLQRQQCLTCGVVTSCVDTGTLECLTCEWGTGFVPTGTTCCPGAHGGLYATCGPNSKCTACGTGKICLGDGQTLPEGCN
jgi:hypothetical protein